VLGGDFEKEVEKAVGRSIGEERDAQKRYREELLAVEKRARDILTKEQREIIEKKPRKPGPEKPKTEAQLIRDELRRIHPPPQDRSGPVGHFLASPMTKEVMAGKFGLEFEGAPEPENPFVPRLKRLRREINLLNLSNVLYLTRGQMERLRDLAGEAGRRRGSVTIDSEKLRQYLEALRRVWACETAGEPVPPELAREFPRLARRAKPARGPGLEDLIGRVKELLTDAQEDLLFDYKHSLLPPRERKNPVRVRMLERVRRIPGEQWEKNRDRIVEGALKEREKKHGAFSGEEREAKKLWLADLLDFVRKMGDADFEREKEELANELRALERDTVLRERLKELSGDRDVVADKIGSFLLDPVLGELMQERLALLEIKPDLKCVNREEISPVPPREGAGGTLKEEKR
jgi:hypothetical protein